MKRVLLVVFAMIALCSAWAEGQDKTKDQPGKARGQLPQNWSKLGLDETQMRVPSARALNHRTRKIHAHPERGL